MIWTWMNSWLFVAWPRYQLYFKNKKTVRTLMTALLSDLCIREEYEKQEDISFRKDKWKSNTGLKFCCEVQILSLNRPRSSWGGKRDFKSQSRKGNKTLTKEEKRKSRIFFLTSTSLHSVASPSAVFLSGFYDGIVLKGPHQGAEIPKDTQLQGLTNE